jgi:acetyl esterase/lipase
VRAVVAISPPTDLAWVGARPQLPLHGSAALSINCPLEACAAAWHRASPVRQVRRGTTPPTWAFDAGADPITPIAPVRAYVERLRAAGIRARLVTTSDQDATCHGPLPCAGVPLAGSRDDLFEHAQAWLARLV